MDFPPEIAHQAFRHRVDLAGLRYLLMTHSHGDHWFPYLLRWRHRAEVISEDPPTNIGGPRFTALPTLHIYGNAAVEAVLQRELGSNLAPYDLEYHCIHPGDSFRAGAVSVTAVRANHDVGSEEALHYICQDVRATVLYGLDGSTFLSETRERLRDFRFDAVVLESTFGQGEGGGHRNFARLTEEADWFRQEKLLTGGGIIVATHFSPHHCPPHRQTEAYLRPFDIIAAWDGMEIEVGRSGKGEKEDSR